MLDSKTRTGDHQVPYLRNVNVQWGRIDTDDLLYVDIHPDDRERFEVRQGDLLVCEGGEVGRCAVWQHPDKQYIAFQKALHRIRPCGGMSPFYLRYYLEHLSLQGHLASRATGSTIKHLPQERLRELPILLPPLEEQQRIVCALEDHLSRLDAGVDLLGRVAVRTKSFSISYLESLLEDLSVRDTTLAGILAEPLVNGRSVPTQPGGFPVLRLTALKNGWIDLAERKEGAWTASEADPYIVQQGDFLVSRGNGSLSLVGRGALVTEVPDKVAFPDTLIRVRANRDIISPEYLRVVWNSRRVRDQIEKAARTTAGIHKVNQRILEDVVLPLPELNVQASLLAKLEALAVVNQSKQVIAAASIRARHLRRSVLVQAFSGRLASQDSGDESTSDLLARMQAERLNRIKTKRPRHLRAPRPAAEAPTGILEELPL